MLLKQLLENRDLFGLVLHNEKTNRNEGWYVADDEDITPSRDHAHTYNSIEAAQKDADFINHTWDLDDGKKFVIQQVAASQPPKVHSGFPKIIGRSNYLTAEDMGNGRIVITDLKNDVEIHSNIDELRMFINDFPKTF